MSNYENKKQFTKEQLREAVNSIENLRISNCTSKYMSRTLEKLLLEMRDDLLKEWETLGKDKG